MKHTVVVFTTSYHPFIGGAEIAIQEVAQRLSPELNFFIITARMRRDLLRREDRPEGTVIRVGLGTRFDKWILPLSIFWNLEFGIWNFTRRSRVLWGMDISQGSLAAAIVKLFVPRIPFVLTVQYGENEERLRLGRLGFLRRAFEFMLRRADHVTVISSYLLELVRRYGYQGPATIIHNGVDGDKLKTQNSKLKSSTQKLKVVITTSRLVPKNAIDTLIQAIAEVKKKIPEIQCYILGDGPERKNLELQATSYKLQADVKFFGSIPHEEIAEYLHRADIFARPSRSEGMGNSFVEALAAGLPIIGTPVGGITDIIEDRKTGLFCKVGDPSDLAGKIVRLLTDRILAETLVRNGRKMVEERFSWDMIAKSYHTVFVPILDRYDYACRSKIGTRVLIATPLYPPDIGGPATYSKLLFDELPLRGYEVKIAHFGTVRHLPKIIRHAAYFWQIFRHAGGTDVVFALDPVSVGLPALLAAKLLRKKFILKAAGDYAWEQYQNHRARIMNPRTGTSSVRGRHEAWFVTPEEFQERRFNTLTELRRKIQQYVARKAETIIVPSNYLKGIVSHWGVPTNKIKVVYNSFEAPPASFSRDAARKKINLSGTVFLSAGRLVPWKGFGTLIELMPEIVKSVPDARLIIIGEGPEEKKLKLKVKNLKLEGYVILLSKLPHQELLQYLAASDIFLLNTGYEGFSHLLLEAMAVGIPIVTTRVGGNPELIEDGVTGLLVAYDNRSELLYAIERLIRDSWLRESLVKKARLKLKEFDYGVMVRKTAASLL